jgi:polyhydroxybutyrate depolymerase
MFKLTFLLSLTSAALLLQPEASVAADCTQLSPGVHHITVTSGGRKQNLDLVLPASFDAGQRVPLVLGLHPSGGRGESFARTTGLREAASAKGFAVMFPDGGVPQQPSDGGGDGYFWNIPGVPLVSGAAVPKGTRDDVRFIGDIIKHVIKHNCVDARRVYVTGFSGGARMTSMVGCRLADRVTAVAPVAGLRAGRALAPEFTEPDVKDCRPSRPVSVMAIHGTDDSTNPFPGGGGVRWGYSIESAAARWASLDHCGVAPALEKVSEHVTRERHGTCGGGSEVVLYKIDAPRDQGGGHVWPGSGSPAGIDATQLVLEFFARH